ncbi:MAG: amino acid ABC transporter permease [Alphaproteobacteria bacterium]|nr:amino acid ABC transporter permease [Alphaproteobacteria bacterium]
MDLDFTIVFEAWPFLLRGVWVTLQLISLVLLVSAPLAVLVALARNSRHGWIAGPIGVLSWAMRGVPPLLVLFLVYFVLPQFGLPIKPFPAAVAGMTLYMMFYFAETVRAGLASVDAGQFQAARALGLPPARTFVRVILPQALPSTIPPYVSHATEVVKNSALTASIAVAELTGNAYQLIISTNRAFEILIAIAIVYGTIDAVLLLLQAKAERKNLRRALR